jgi:hypothetical protein
MLYLCGFVFFVATLIEFFIGRFSNSDATTALYLLAAAVFLTGGVLAFLFDAVGVPRHGFATGRSAHWIGALDFLVAAFFLHKYLRETRVSRTAMYLPYAIAILASVVFLILKSA